MSFFIISPRKIFKNISLKNTSLKYPSLFTKFPGYFFSAFFSVFSAGFRFALTRFGLTKVRAQEVQIRALMPSTVFV